MKRATFIKLFAALAILAALSGGIWWIASKVRGALHDIETAEARLGAVRETLNLTLDYVDQKDDWPRSWDDLFSLKRWTYGRDPSWRARSSHDRPLPNLVEFNFGLALEDAREDSPFTFHAIRPKGGAAAVPLEPDYANFLSSLRRLVPRIPTEDSR
jgi:hypothetical protein